jgi:gluconate 2-dehydrogenase alpha chain
MMNAVGGTTQHYWAQSWRLNPWDFKVVSETARRYGAGRIPKGSTVEDWPFGFGELERYYDLVEHEVGVSGQAGNIGGRIDDRGNIFEGPRRRDYPMPPLRGTEFTDMMGETARKLGWHAFPGPAAIASRTYEDRPGCFYHGYCSRGGCPINAKSSTAVTTIPKAQATALERYHAGNCHEHRCRSTHGPHRRRDIPQRRAGVFSTCRCRSSRRLHLRECAPSSVVEVARVP